MLSWLKEVVQDFRYDRQIAALRANDRRHPVELFAQHLGIVRFDSITRVFSGRSLWNGLLLDVTLETGVPDVVLAEKYAASAEPLWQNASNWLQRSRELATRDLLETINIEMVKGGEQPLSEMDFQASLTPFWIGVDNLEAFSLLFDGDPFGDLPILVLGTFAGGPIEARI